MGRHLESLAQYAPIMKLYLFGDVAYTTTMACTKFSILVFYLRIFGETPTIRWLIYLLMGISAMWGVEVVRLSAHQALRGRWTDANNLEQILVSILSCSPVRYTWDLAVSGGHCIDLYAWFISTLVINFVNDIAILVLPIPFIWRLNQSRAQNTLVSGMSLLGGL